MCEYNGWANWDTWNANLYISNTYGSPAMIEEQIPDIWRNREGYIPAIVSDLADWIADNGDHLIPMTEDRYGNPRLGDGIDPDRVRWEDIASHYVDDYEPEGEEEEED